MLYFYPRDDTPGCTAEACSFRDLRALFKEHGAEILGVSTDTVKSHKKFQAKFHLTFPLLADTDHAVADQYGVWQQKKFMGREYMGIARTTFVVDKDGTIKAVFPNVKVEGHADKVLEGAEGLSRSRPVGRLQDRSRSSPAPARASAARRRSSSRARARASWSPT